jgi:hypothetical protein
VVLDTAESGEEFRENSGAMEIRWKLSRAEEQAKSQHLVSDVALLWQFRAQSASGQRNPFAVFPFRYSRNYCLMAF